MKAELNAPRFNDGGGEQFNGCEGETATLYERRSLNSNGLGGGFAPRHLSRSASVFRN